MFPPMTRYRDTYKDFRWAVPETFNFAADVVDRRAAEADDLALICEGADGAVAHHSFSDIARRTGRFADTLARLGIRQGDRVLIMLPRIAEWQVAMVGALKMGAVPIPCIEMLTARDLAYRVRNAGAKAVVARASQVEKFAEVAAEVPVRISLGADAAGQADWHDWHAVLAAGDPDFAPATVAAEDPAIIYYTSGSTGEPKGVTHAARALWAWRASAVYWLDLRPGERIWCTADTGWSKAGTSILFGPWSCGASALFYDGPFDPAGRLALLAKHRINVYCAPATELYRVVDEAVADHDLSALRRTVSAGEPMNPAVADRWREATGLQVSEAYGQTETLMTVLNYPCEPVKPGSMGLPSPGTRVAILDDAGRELAAGEKGHIAVLTPNPQMMLGYWRDPARSAACFVEGPAGRWFLTGDRGARDDEGYLFYAGRDDDVINSAGYRIGPLEVENALLEHPGVLECAVVGSPDRERGELVKAFVVLRPGQSGSPELAAELQAQVKAVTAPYKYPRRVEFVDALPKTITGKIKRRALRDLERARAAGEH